MKIDLLASQGLQVGQFAEELQPYRSDGCLPLMFSNAQGGYDYQLQTHNWTLSPVDESLLVLEKHLGRNAFYIDYSAER